MDDGSTDGLYEILESARDGFLALAASVKVSLVDDLYHDDEYGFHILHQLERTHRFNTWMADVLRPFVGDRVLEIGAGIGNSSCTATEVRLRWCFRLATTTRGA